MIFKTVAAILKGDGNPQMKKNPFFGKSLTSKYQMKLLSFEKMK